jgi:hypothetical protein
LRPRQEIEPQPTHFGRISKMGESKEVSREERRLKEAADKIGAALKGGAYCNLMGSPENCLPVVDQVVAKLEEDCLVLRFPLVSGEGSALGIIKNLAALLPEESSQQLPASSRQDFLTFFPELARICPQPLVIILENIQFIDENDRSLVLRTLRSFYNQKGLVEPLSKLAFLLVGDRHPDDLLLDDSLTPYNIGEDFIV